MSKKRTQELIRIIHEKGEYDKEGSRAISELAELGKPALDLMIESLDQPPESSLHPRDLWDSIQGAFSAFAGTIPDALIEALKAGSIEPQIVYWALGSAQGERSIDVLVCGLKEKNQYARWAAAESLVRRQSKRATPALLDALRDRSSMVQSTVVSAMKSNKAYRRPEAIPALKRIVANKSIRKHSPGLWKTAQELIETIRAEVQQ